MKHVIEGLETDEPEYVEMIPEKTEKKKGNNTIIWVLVIALVVLIAVYMLKNYYDRRDAK